MPHPTHLAMTFFFLCEVLRVYLYRNLARRNKSHTTHNVYIILLAAFTVAHVVMFENL